MSNKMHIKYDGTNAQLLRDLFKEGQLPDTNKRIQKFILDVYGREITISQIAAVLGRYTDRPILSNRHIDEIAHKFIQACRYDIGLCKRILNRNRGLYV